MNNDELLEKINKRFDTLEHGQKQLEQGQAQTNTTVAQIKTVVETLEAVQKDIRAEMATKADVLHLGVKVDKVRKRVEGIEEYEGIHNPDKN